jgi:hypothetical protein
LTASQKARNGRFLSFRRIPDQGPGQAPESSSFVELQIIWTPVSTGVTTSHEALNLAMRPGRSEMNIARNDIGAMSHLRKEGLSGMFIDTSMPALYTPHENFSHQGMQV